jgi:hypothetical protein
MIEYEKRFDEYTNRMLCSARNPEKVESLRTYVLGGLIGCKKNV